MKQLLHSSSHIAVPPALALCPYCGAALGIAFDGFEQNEDGTWSVTAIETECPSEPEFDEEDWEDWFASHSDMPYVYQLPVEMKIIEWINAHYFFDLEGEDKLISNVAISPRVAAEQGAATDPYRLALLAFRGG